MVYYLATGFASTPHMTWVSLERHKSSGSSLSFLPLEGARTGECLEDLIDEFDVTHFLLVLVDFRFVGSEVL